MSALAHFQEWLAEFPADIETLLDIRENTKHLSVVQAIDNEIHRRKKLRDDSYEPR